MAEGREGNLATPWKTFDLNEPSSVTHNPRPSSKTPADTAIVGAETVPPKRPDPQPGGSRPDSVFPASSSASRQKSQPDLAPHFFTAPPAALSSTSFSLSTLLAIVTGVAVFLAVYRWNSSLALLGTLVLTPALIRTLIVADCLKRLDQPLGWRDHLNWMCGSILMVLSTLLAGAIAFLGVSVLCGCLGMLLGFAVGNGGLAIDTAIVGTAGGMIWGLGGGLLAITYFIWRFWLPPSVLE